MIRQSHDSNFEAIFRDYGKGLYLFLFRLSGSQHDAEDLVQESFLTVMKKLQTFKGESSMKTWLYAIAINKYRDSLRHSKLRAKAALAGDEVHSSQDPLDDLEAGETGDRLSTAFYRLTEHHRTALTLVRFEGMSYKDAANALGTTLDTVRMRVHHAHLQLAEQLKEVPS